MKDALMSLLFQAVLLTTIALDPDGASYGTQLLGAENVPGYLIVGADFLGNLTWVLGLLFLIGSIVVGTITFGDDLLKKEAAKLKDTDPKKWKKWGKRQWYSKYLLGLSVIVSVFALGSGFWFLGLTWVVMLLVTLAYIKERETLRAKMDAEELLAEVAKA